MKYVVTNHCILLEALSKASPESSKNTLRSWLKEGRVEVDGNIISKGSHPLTPQQIVKVNPRSRSIEGGIRILYQDSHFVVIEKPSGLLSVATNFEAEKTAHAILKRQFYPKRVSVVHRLDQETSGVMVFGLSEQGLQGLKKRFKDHDIERNYVGIIEGHLDEESGTWKSHLFEDANYCVHSTKNPQKGELAITHYQVQGKSKKYTWLDLKLETGKKNQIRVHCQDAGHPIVGDLKYGATANPIKRLGLHAYLLAFQHPVTNKAMQFRSSIPESFFHIIKPHKETNHA